MQLLRRVFPESSEETLKDILNKFMLPRVTQADKLVEAVRSNPEMALGMEALMQLDPSSASDFKEMTKIVNVVIMEEKPDPTNEDAPEDAALGDDNGDDDDDAPETLAATETTLVAIPVTPIVTPFVAPIVAPVVAPIGAPIADAESSSDESPSSSSGDASENSSAEAAGSTSAAATVARKMINKTPACLRTFLSHPRQGISQDVRENRFKGSDPRESDLLAEGHDQSKSSVRPSSLSLMLVNWGPAAVVF